MGARQSVTVSHRTTRIVNLGPLPPDMRAMSEGLIQETGAPHNGDPPGAREAWERYRQALSAPHNNLMPQILDMRELCLELIRAPPQGYNISYIPSHLQTPPLNVQSVTPSTTNLHHGDPKKMPENAFDTLMLEYSDETAIKDGELMVDFHAEFENGRFYRWKTFNDMTRTSMTNPYTREPIVQYHMYLAKV